MQKKGSQGTAQHSTVPLMLSIRRITVNRTEQNRGDLDLDSYTPCMKEGIRWQPCVVCSAWCVWCIAQWCYWQRQRLKCPEVDTPHQSTVSCCYHFYRFQLMYCFQIKEADPSGRGEKAPVDPVEAQRKLTVKIRSKYERRWAIWAELHCTVLNCTVLYCTALHCTVLHCTLLYCTVLYCN